MDTATAVSSEKLMDVPELAAAARAYPTLGRVVQMLDDLGPDIPVREKFDAVGLAKAILAKVDAVADIEHMASQEATYRDKVRERDRGRGVSGLFRAPA